LQSRAKFATELLSELNNDVSGDFVEEVRPWFLVLGTLFAPVYSHFSKIVGIQNFNKKMILFFFILNEQ